MLLFIGSIFIISVVSITLKQTSSKDNNVLDYRYNAGKFDGVESDRTDRYVVHAEGSAYKYDAPKSNGLEY